MGKENIIVIGGDDFVRQKAIGYLHSIEDAILISSEQSQLPLQQSEPIPYKNRPELKMYNENTFECKGKHQYRQVKTTQEDGFILVEWKCQCGKTC